MTAYHATINLTFDAVSEEQALKIAQICARAIEQHQPYKIEVDIDDVEEN